MSEPLSRPLTGDVRLELVLPDGTRGESSEALPALDVSMVPGARVVDRFGVRLGGVTFRAACVQAPTDVWAPGIESLVFDRATALARGASSLPLVWAPGTIERRGGLFEQRLAGTSPRLSSGAMRHVLAFAGSRQDAILCSFVCASEDRSEACAAIVDAARLTGTLADPPGPSALARLLLLAADRPRAALACFVAIAAAVVVLVLARRPRPTR